MKAKEYQKAYRKNIVCTTKCLKSGICPVCKKKAQIRLFTITNKKTKKITKHIQYIHTVRHSVKQ